LEVELPDAQHLGARHEIDVARGLPDPGPPNEPQGWCKTLVDPIERDKVVEEVVGIIGGDAPRLRRARDAGNLRARNPGERLEILAVNDQGKIDVEPAAPLWAGYTGTRTLERHGAYIGALKEIALYAEDQVVGFVPASGPSVQKSKRPGARLSRQSGPTEDRYRLPVLPQADPPGIEQLGNLLGTEVEDAARLEEEPALLGKEDREPGQVDDLAINLDLGKVGVHGEVGGEGRRHGELGVNPRLRGHAAAPETRPGGVVVVFGRPCKHIRHQLERASAPQRIEAGELPFVQEAQEAFGTMVGLPEGLLVLPADKPLYVEPQAGRTLGETERLVRNAELGSPAE